MDTREQSKQRQDGAAFEVEAPLATAMTPEPAAASSDPQPIASAEETVFSILASRARTRAPSHLWITAAVGAIDAIALMIARPTLWWVAAGCAAVTAYSVWGLADRALGNRDRMTLRDSTWLVLKGVRGVAVVTGIAATVVTVFGFVGAALGRGALGW